MIPKIIHTFWGGDCDVRDKSFLWNWEEVLVPAGYEIKVWKPEDFTDIDCDFYKKVVEYKQWAHASDYIRFKVLNEYGGFWMDTDVFVFKPFDKLLKAEYIISLANGGDWENKDSFNNCNIHNTFKFCMSCVGFKKGHPIVQGILNEYKKTGYDIIDSGYECMDVSSFMLRYLSENNLNVTELTDINYTEKLYGELDELTKFDGENVVLLPPCMFDYRYADESLHELMYASHKHWSLWTPKYSESIEKVKLTDKLVDELTGDVIVSISEKVKNLLFSEFKKEIKDTIVKSLKDKYNDKIDFNLI